jgi:hypothetical protein
MPVGGGCPGLLGVFQPPVEPLYQPVRLRVVSGSGGVVDVEQAAQGRPQGGRELGPSVECDGCQHSEPGDPAGEKGPCTVGRGVERSGIASSHRDVLSITVNRYVWPLEGGSGPTRSKCMCAKRR